MRRWRRTVPALLATVVLAACGGPINPTPNPQPTPVPARTSWALRHRVTDSADWKVTGHTIGHYDEATSVTVGREANGFEISCHVSLSAPGQGGPENEIGEKVPVTVRGRPGLRSGAGAEHEYLMWQHAGDAWTQVACPDPEQRRNVDALAKAIQYRSSSILLPFDIDALPEGYGLSTIHSDFGRGSTEVYFGDVNPAFGHADPDSVIAYEAGPEPLRRPAGRPITINGRPAMLSEDPEGPGVCVFVQQSHVCVSAETSDTGPFPDRSGEIPTLVGIAESLRFATDLDDRSTWFRAENVFG